MFLWEGARFSQVRRQQALARGPASPPGPPAGLPGTERQQERAGREAPVRGGCSLSPGTGRHGWDSPRSLHEVGLGVATCPGLNQIESEPGCLLAPGSGRGSSLFDPHYPSPSWPEHSQEAHTSPLLTPWSLSSSLGVTPPPRLVPRSPKGAPCDGAPGHPRRGGPFPGGGGAAAVRTRRRPGRVGKRGEGRAPRAGRSWERPPPPAGL